MKGVRLLALHPRILDRPCSDCRAWLYDERHQLILHRGQPIARPPGVPTPCSTCPKHDPLDGAYFDRHATNIAWLIRRRAESAATGGACLTRGERRDAILHRNLGIVDAVLGQLEAEHMADRIAALLSSRMNRF